MTCEFWMRLKMISPGLIEQSPNASLAVFNGWPSTSKPELLTGTLTGFFKLRAGDYRIIYKVRKDENLIVIHRIGHRREVYKL